MNKKLLREEEKFKKLMDKMESQDNSNDNKGVVNESLVDLYDSIDKLPVIYGDVMKLLLNGFSERQIAEKLQIQTGTVKSRTYRGREMLQKILRGGEA
jgi:DNA-directed RNA polymerase specialized sigma24 family protein